MAILAQQYPVYQPAMRIISTITKGFPTGIITTFAHQYKTGAIIRVHIPPGYGMQQINQLYGVIAVVSDTSFAIGIDSSKFEEYFVPTGYPDNRQYAQVTPVGEFNEYLNSAVVNVLPYSAT